MNENSYCLIGGGIIGLFFGVLIAGLIISNNTQLGIAERGGFSIGSGVLGQEWHCTEITKHIGIESAKKQVSDYQAMVRG